MISSYQRDVACNLSYVLHEPSTSSAVRNGVATLEAELRRCDQATARLAAVDDQALARQVVVLDERGALLPSRLASLRIFSLRIGAWQFLQRILTVSGNFDPATHVDLTFMDETDDKSMRLLSLFRAPALLNAPEKPELIAGEDYFATAVFRPGHKSILLRMNRLDPATSDSTSCELYWQAVTRYAETALREFHFQWCCRRALWERPAEDALAEFGSFRSGLAECGR